MPEATVIAQFERRLVELGCPPLPLSARVRELADHHEDLKQAALAEGLPEPEATARASSQLGDPLLLAENAVLLLRRTSWWGRHPLLGFGVLPVLGFIPAWAAVGGILMGLCWLLGRIFGPAYAIDWQILSALGDDPKVVARFEGPVNAAVTVAAILLVVIVFCRLAQRAATSLKWRLVVCAVCSLFSMFNDTGFYPHEFSIGVWWQPSNWFYALVPLLFAAVLLARQRRRENRLAWVPMPRRMVESPGFPVRAAGWQTRLLTPTYWVVAVLTLAIIVCIFEIRTELAHEKIQRAGLKSKIWPAERAATLAILQTRQAMPVAAGGTMVDLKPWLNANLKDATGEPSGIIDNNLAELSAGVHAFGGVAFAVAGRIQLAGQPLEKSKQKYPVRVQLPLSGRYAQIYLLHGAENLRTPGVKIARLVWRYADGSKAETAIVGGESVLDWWGPIYDTDSGIGRHTTSPDTELAWAGSNPGIRKHAPDFSLRLYKSAFTNPHPELEIARIDYISTLSGAAPFLVGLTAEPSSSTTTKLP